MCGTRFSGEEVPSTLNLYGVYVLSRVSFLSMWSVSLPNNIPYDVSPRITIPTPEFPLSIGVTILSLMSCDIDRDLPFGWWTVAADPEAWVLRQHDPVMGEEGSERRVPGQLTLEPAPLHLFQDELLNLI